MTPNELIQKECVRLCKDAGLPMEKAEGLAQMAVTRYRTNALRNAGDVHKWINKQIKDYRRAMKNAAGDPIRRAKL